MTSLQFLQSFFEKPSLGFLPGETESTMVGVPGLLNSPHPPAEVGTRSMRQMIFSQITACQNVINESESG